MSWNDFDPPELYSETKRTARKTHTCSECRGLIQKGEVYVYHKGIWEGDFSEFKHCSDCNRLLKEAEIKDQHSSSWLFGDIETYIYEVERGDKEIPLTEAFGINRDRRLELRKQMEERNG